MHLLAENLDFQKYSLKKHCCVNIISRPVLYCFRSHLSDPKKKKKILLFMWIH